MRRFTLILITALALALGGCGVSPASQDDPESSPAAPAPVPAGPIDWRTLIDPGVMYVGPLKTLDIGIQSYRTIIFRDGYVCDSSHNNPVEYYPTDQASFDVFFAQWQQVKDGYGPCGCLLELTDAGWRDIGGDWVFMTGDLFELRRTVTAIGPDALVFESRRADTGEVLSNTFAGYRVPDDAAVAAAFAEGFEPDKRQNEVGYDCTFTDQEISIFLTNYSAYPSSDSLPR